MKLHSHDLYIAIKELFNLPKHCLSATITLELDKEVVIETRSYTDPLQVNEKEDAIVRQSEKYNLVLKDLDELDRDLYPWSIDTELKEIEQSQDSTVDAGNVSA